MVAPAAKVVAKRASTSPSAFTLSRAAAKASYCAVVSLAVFLEGCAPQPADNPPFRYQEAVNSLGMTLVNIPAGSFYMGSDEPQAMADGDGPRHLVRVSRDFWIGKFEVTQDEYQQVMGVNPSSSYDSSDGAAKGADADADASQYPVDRVTWEEAVEYCRRLSTLAEEKAAHRTYRLPTDAEWEYACCAGETEADGAGDGLSTDLANISAPVGGGNAAVGRTAKVGSYRPNAWGLCDMHGNVWEWCTDGRREYSTASAVDPRGPDVLDVVLRGGAWDYPADYARTVRRQTALKGYVYFGFRVVCETPAAAGEPTSREP